MRVVSKYSRGAKMCVEISELNWIEFFERFLNPERISMPDFDIDFCTDRRDEVIAYVAKKYGAEKVSAEILSL